VRDDIYVREGVWLDDARARAFGRVVIAPTTLQESASGASSIDR
jgi:hypothetical protein